MSSPTGVRAEGAHLLLQLARTLRNPRRFWQQRAFRRRYAKRIGATDHCYIAQNCVGGRLYDLEGRAYASPTVGSWFTPADFLSFCERLEDHLAAEVVEDPEASARIGYPVGMIGQLRIWFQHYPTFEAARTAWIKRAARVRTGKVFVVMTDRDGFVSADLERFRALPHRKLLLSHVALPDPDIVHVPGYEHDGQVGDLYGAFQRLDHPRARERLFALLRAR